MFVRKLSISVAVMTLFTVGPVYSGESPFPMSPNETTPWHVLYLESSGLSADNRQRTFDNSPGRRATDARPSQVNGATSSMTGSGRAATTAFPYSPNETGLAW